MSGRKVFLRRTMSVSLFLLVAFLSVYFFMHSSWFNIEEVAVIGNRVVLAGEIKALSGIIPGTNIFEINTSRAQRAVMIHPMIKEARIIRHLPHQVEIKVTERKPWAVIPSGSSFLVVDDCGVCISRVESLKGVSCPLITIDGLPARVVPGQRLAPQAFEDLNNIIRQLPKQVIEQISEFHYARNRQVYIYTLKGTEIRFGGQDRLKEKTSMVGEVFEMERRSEGEAIAYIDLRFKGQPVVRLKDQAR